MKIYVFPKLEHIENFDKCFEIIKTKALTKFENSDTIQASSDGCWKCEKGLELRDKKKKIRVNKYTLQESTADDKDSIVVDDWIPADGHTGTKADIEYIITAESEITQNDIDQHIQNINFVNWGNGFSTLIINKKPCCIVCCNDTLTNSVINAITTEIQNPEIPQ